MELLELVTKQAVALLDRYIALPVLWRADFLGELRPTCADFQRVFIPEVAVHLEAGYADLWEEPRLWPVPTPCARRVAGAWSHQVATAPSFPDGYRDAARYLRAGVPWFCWDFGSHSFDGLVVSGSRWCWFPRPWKAVPRDHTPVDFWVE